LGTNGPTQYRDVMGMSEAACLACGLTRAYGPRHKPRVLGPTQYLGHACASVNMYPILHVILWK